MDKIAKPQVEHFVFGSKAVTLQTLAARLQHGKVLPLFCFTVKEWREDAERILKSATAHFGDQRLIVRSSSLSEDQSTSSAAGCYCSVPNVYGSAELRIAIEQVIHSYHSITPNDEVFIQPMAQGVLASGVAMNRAPESALPYYVINYTLDGNTAAVTSGERCVLAFTAYKYAPVEYPIELAGLFPLLQELEQLTGQSALDVEFALTDQGPLLLQVRPMTALEQGKITYDPERLHATLYQEIARLDKEQDLILAGQRKTGALFGIMPDWNPAEMIGIKPRPLAYSLYKELITDVNWASARFRYGYRDLRNQQLMNQFCGTPYICIPRSIESFIPAALPQDMADTIREACCTYLAAHQHLHDKLEFTIIPTCYTPSLELGDVEFDAVFSVLTAQQRTLYLTELKRITEHIISPNGPFFNDLQLIPNIQQQVEQLMEVPDNDLHAFRLALQEAKITGELFSGVARAAFIATAILKSIERLGKVDTGFTDTLIAQGRTVGKQVSEDFQILDKEAFLLRHGHIRPGTYDIRVHRYDENADAYFDWSTDISLHGIPEDHISIERKALQAIEHIFQECQLQVSVNHFLRFTMSAIAAREKVKYLYGALVSEALKRLTHWGAIHGFSRDDLSFLTLNKLLRMDKQAAEHLHSTLEGQRAAWSMTSQLRVPEVICRSQDLLGFISSMVHPNYITHSVAEAAVCVLTPDATNKAITDKIVLIASADPGFDWIFTHHIRGFITAYGGENSHMSIRAREFSIPAAIGVGDALFRSLSQSSRVMLDCAGQRIQVLQ